MARELTWQFDTNHVNGGSNVPKNVHSYYMWYMLKFLTGRIGGATQGLWTCVASCDGTTAQAGDVFADTFDTAKWVRSYVASAARSWYVLRSPQSDGGLDLFIKIDYWCDGDLKMRYQIGTGISGGYTTPGTPPTITALYHNNDNFPMHDGTATTFKVHGCLTPDGEFYILGSKDGSGKFQCVFTMRRLASRAANDTYAWIGKAGYSTNDVFNRTADSTGGMYTNAGGAGSPGFGCRRQNGTVQSVTPFYPTFQQSGNTGWIPGSALEHPNGMDIQPDGTYLMFPMVLAAGYNSSDCYYKGRIPDMFLVHSNRADGDRFPATGDVEYVVAGICAIPFNQVPSL